MSAAARAATRSAGRGVSLNQSHAPAPTRVGRIRPHDMQTNAPSAAGRGTPQEGETAGPRSSLTTSILYRRTRQDHSRPNRDAGAGRGGGGAHQTGAYRGQRRGTHRGGARQGDARREGAHSGGAHYGEEPYYAGPMSGRRRDHNAKRRAEDWYTSSARKEALADLAQASSGLVEASRRSDGVINTAPFAWAELGRVANQLPDGHWARGFVSGVASNIERNDAIEGEKKEKILEDVLTTLGRLSRENDERFQDAEQ